MRGLEEPRPICAAVPSSGHTGALLGWWATQGSGCKLFYSTLLGERAHVAHLLKFVGYHGESLEDGISGASDGHNSLRAVSLRDVDPCTALEREGQAWYSHSQATHEDAPEAQPFFWVRSCPSLDIILCASLLTPQLILKTPIPAPRGAYSAALP